LRTLPPITKLWPVTSGLYLGWALGSNDAANVFGTAVATRVIPFYLAGWSILIFATIGAVLEGYGGFETLGKFGHMTPTDAFWIALSAAATVTLMTYLGLPVSTSQAIVGAIIGAGAVHGTLNLSPLGKVVSSWIATPIGAGIIAYFLYFILKPVIYWLGKAVGYIAGFLGRRRTGRPHGGGYGILWWDNAIWWGLMLSGIYGAYSLGANNVANVMGVFVASGTVSPFMGALLGGLSIGVGALTYGRKVMETVGTGIVRLSPYTALVVVLAEAITVHFFAVVGVPVSTSQAVVGGVIGIGFVEGVSRIDKKTTTKVLFGWFGTPTIAGIVSAIVAFLVGLFM
jgi:PiT family inorganic phosphate transporter